MTEVIRRGHEAARVGPWRGAAATALLAPAPGYLGPPSPNFLRWCAEHLAGQGFQRVVSSALLPTDTAPYLEAGFSVLEQLHLLSRRLDPLPTMPDVRARLRKGHRGDLATVVEIDQQAFQPFWRFDAEGITEARSITPRARFRVAVAPEGRLVGYAVTGLGDEQGYLQRLAVAPDRQRQGTGAALVIDALSWLARRHAQRVMVNTQVSNERALRLYQSLGFHLESARLEVLSLDLQ